VTQRILTLLALIVCAAPALAQTSSGIIRPEQIRLDNACYWDSGTGSPEGVRLGAVCDVWYRTDGSTGTTIYVKQSGTRGTPTNTGWAALGASGSGVTTIADEGSNLTARATVNFTGAGVSCADNAGATRTDCTISGGGGGSESEGVVYKAADTNRNTTTTLTDDPDLQVPLDASSVYYVEVFLLLQDTSGGTADFKFGWTVPSGATFRYGAIGGTNGQWDNVGVGTTPSSILSAGSAMAQGGGSAALTTGLAWFGIAFTDVTSGSLVLQWAQNTSSGSDVTLKRGSFIRYRKLN
jgi:hypothetical protein